VHHIGGLVVIGARGTVQRGVDALLLLPAVAEPHAHHLLLHAQAIGQLGDLLGSGFLVGQEGLLQGPANGGLDGGALLAAASDDLGGAHGGLEGRRIEDTSGGLNGAIGVVQPLLEQRLQLAHVLEAQVQGLEP